MNAVAYKFVLSKTCVLSNCVCALTILFMHYRISMDGNFEAL
jgi:hypothetical protein